ncbi:hypothetical protein GCM10027088_33430 [Nocardia goodfellowii]
MEAARELDRFIGANASQLSDVESLFVAEATRRFPSDPKNQHRDAASLVHKNIHEIMDKRDALKKAGASEDEISEARDLLRSQLQAQLDELTGRPDYFAKYGSVWSTITRRNSGVRILRSSLLINIVSDFEVLISGLVRAVIETRPEILRSSERRFTYQDIESFVTITEFRRHCGERVAEDLLRGSFNDWMDWLAKRHKIEVVGVTDCPVSLVEVFQRRHLLVHAGGVVNAIYLSNTKGIPDPPEIGHRLRVSSKYLRESVAMLLVAAIKLCVTAARKFAKSPDADLLIDRDLSSLSFGLLLREHYSIVETINEWHLEAVGNDATRIICTVNRWIARKKLHGLEAIRREVEEWDTSTLALRYAATKSALLDRNEDAYQLVKKALESGELPPDGWRNWPVFENVREYALSKGADSTMMMNWPFEAPHSHAGPSVSPDAEHPTPPPNSE